MEKWLRCKWGNQVCLHSHGVLGEAFCKSWCLQKIIDKSDSTVKQLQITLTHFMYFEEIFKLLILISDGASDFKHETDTPGQVSGAA